MNSKNQYERELRQLIDFNLSSSNNNKSTLDLETRIKYYKAQECFMASDLPACFKQLILNYTDRLNSSLGDKKPLGAIEQLESLVSNDFKLNLITVSNLANSLRNDFFLNLVTSTQSIVDWLSASSLPSCRASTCFLFNNLSILNFALKKYAMGCFFAKKALAESRRIGEEKSNSDDDNKDDNKEEKEANCSDSINKQLIGNAAIVKVRVNYFKRNIEKKNKTFSLF